MTETFAYYMLLNLQIVCYKIGTVHVISHNSAHLGSGQNHILRLFGIKKSLYRSTVQQIQFPVGAPHQVGISFCFQVVPDGRAHKSAVTGHIYLCIFIHYSK